MTSSFWQTKSLFAMNKSEWESICDGCGKCCLQQLQDDKTEELVFTDVACDLFEQHKCRCSDYKNRSERVPQCLTMTADNVVNCAEFAPPSCAYRLLLEGKQLPSWHHLQSGDPETVHTSQNSVRGRVRLKRHVDPEKIEDYVVDWV